MSKNCKFLPRLQYEYNPRYYASVLHSTALRPMQYKIVYNPNVVIDPRPTHQIAAAYRPTVLSC